jgi:hypothetical protein
MADDCGLPRLTPLSYHDAVVQYLRTSEPEVWQWAGSAQARSEHADAVRRALLKETYRLDPDAHPDLHRSCTVASSRLGITAPVTLYQVSDGAMNAALYYLPGEVHVVFTGLLLERLRGAELEAVLGHEFSHYVLWELADGAYHSADRLLNAAAQDPRASPSHLQTARLYRLYTEAYADRGAAVACGGLLPAVAALVKTQTGLTDVSAPHYLKQADEIVAPGAATSSGESHPEVFVRARGLRLWCESHPEADAWLGTTLEGPLSIDSLDLIAQQRLAALTRQVLAQLLRPRCLRSEGMLAHARRFFADFEPDTGPNTELDAEVAAAPGTHEYVAYLLLDFSVADRELDDVPLAAALELARRLGIANTFERFVQKDLAMPKRQFTKLKQDASALLAKAEQQHG